MSPSPWPVVDAGERMLILGAGGIGAALVFETLSMRASQGWSWTHSFYSAVNVVGTVGPAHGGFGWTYWLPAGLMLLLTVGFAAMFVAGLVDRLVRPPLSSVVGRRSVPRSGHVIVVGLGQVGLRLCRELQSLGIPVVGVERDERATNLRFARTEKIPVIVGHGEDRGLLRALRLDRAIALAAVSSEDLDNVAVAVAAHAIADQVSVVLRAGEQEAVAETRSLLPLGITRDVTAATAASVVAAMEGSAASVVLQVGDQVGVWTPEGEFGHWLPRRSALGSGVDIVREVRPSAAIR
jgi:voltage-gated potassium channel Kch